MRRAFQYRAQLSHETEAHCLNWLERCRTLYNLALEQRIMVYRQGQKTLSSYDQQNQLPEFKKAFPEFTQVGSQCLQDVLERLDKAYQAFFRRVKAGQKAGFPRFKSRDRYNSFTLKQSGWKLEGRYLHLAKIGRLKIHLSRPIEGNVKTVTIRRIPTGKWFVSFSCDEVQPRSFPVTTAIVGIDVGSRSFCVDSEALTTNNPKFLKQSQALLRRRQRKLARRKKGSQRRESARILVAKAHERITNQRKDFLHKLSDYYIRGYKTICIEELDIASMARKTRNSRYTGKAIADAGWGEFFQMLSYKAEEAGREIVKVPPKGTSETCSRCGSSVPKSIDTRVHRCPSCNLKLGRDLNAAVNLLRLGQSLQALTQADVRPSVA